MLTQADSVPDPEHMRERGRQIPEGADRHLAETGRLTADGSDGDSEVRPERDPQDKP
jgi:hypothetical protein